MSDPIYDGVHGTEPGESEDDVLMSTAHDIEEMFLDNPFDVGVKGASIANCTGFVHSLIDIANSDCYDSPLFFSFLGLTFLFS